MTDFEALIQTLHTNGVAFILVGGAAAIAHGSSRMTQDLDIVYDRSAANLDRIVKALAPHTPYLRGVPAGLPFRWERATLDRGFNFTLTTTLGDIDLLGEVAGGGSFEDLRPEAIELKVFKTHCLCLSLSQLIQTKRAAGRPKDLEALAELEAIEEDGP